MSGNKRTYVSVDNNELQRLRDQERSLTALNKELPERLAAIRRQSEKEIQRRLRPLEARQREYEKKIGKFKSDLSTLEKSTHKRLVKQQKEFTGMLENQRGEYLTLINKQGEKLTSLIEHEKRERKKEISKLDDQLKSIAADAERKKSIAESFIVDLRSVVNEVDLLPHTRFAPGEMEKVNRGLVDAEENMRLGMAEAALGTAQKTYWEASDLRLLVLQKEKEFLLFHEAAIQEAQSLLVEARSNRILEMQDESQGDGHRLEVDHWTHGELSDHEEVVQNTLQSLEAEVDTLSIEEVKEILAELEGMASKTNEIVDHARKNILASQLRVSIGQRASEALEEQMFDIVDCTYEGDDFRNAYVVKLKNIAGTEVVTVISPVEGEYGKNEVSIHSFDKTYKDEVVYQQRAQQFVSFIAENGLQAEAPVCMGDANTNYQDLDEVRGREVVQHKTRSRVKEI